MMKWSWRREVFALAVLAALYGLAIYSYSSLPDPMPSHFDAEGNINGWMGKATFMCMMTALTLGMYCLLTFLPLIDPLWKKMEPKYGLLLLIRDVLIGFLSFVFCLNIVAAKDGHLRYELLGVALGLLLIVLGYYMPKLPQNWFVGIRSPWTLSSAVIWRKTNVVGAWLFALSGAVFIVSSLLRLPFAISLVVLIGTSLYAGIVYPLYLFRKLPKNDGAP